MNKTNRKEFLKIKGITLSDEETMSFVRMSHMALHHIIKNLRN